jgi:hypothetical protein
MVGCLLKRLFARIDRAAYAPLADAERRSAEYFASFPTKPTQTVLDVLEESDQCER